MPWNRTPEAKAAAAAAAKQTTPAAATSAATASPAVVTPAAARGNVVKPPGKEVVAAAAAGNAAIVVSTQSREKGVEVQILIGSYVEKGDNHGRKFYQKKEQIPGHPDVKVFLYFWDNRDGADFSGWWFGDQVGGSQVWARCNSQAMAPPRVGWMVPWDAPKAEPGLLLVEANKPGGGQATATGTMDKVTAVSKATQAKAEVDKVEVECRKELNNMKALWATVDQQKLKGATEAPLKEILAKVEPMDQQLKELEQLLLSEVAEVKRGGMATSGAVAELSRLMPRLKALQHTVSGEVTKAQTKLGLAQNSGEQEKYKQAEEKDRQAYQEAVPPVQEGVDGAKEAVEAITEMAAKLMAEEFEDKGEILEQGLGEIEAAAKAAQGKITDVRMLINAQLRSARSYAPETQKVALKEYTLLQQTLTEAQKSLNLYKNYRKEYHAQVAAKKAFAEVKAKVDTVEEAAEKAGKLSAVTDEAQMSETEVLAAEEIVGPALQEITSLMRLIDAKFMASPALKSESVTLKERGQKTKAALDQVVIALRPKREKLASQKALQLARARIEKADEALAKCTEMEMPFLKGLEVLPGEESTKAIDECEKAAAETHACITQAVSFIKLKLTDSKGYQNTELGKAVGEELQQLQEKLEECQKKLSAFKTSTAERKTEAIVAEVKDMVADAESKVQAFVEAAALFNSETLEEEPVEQLKEASVKAVEAEKVAGTALLETRKKLALKQREAKVSDTAGALAKLNTRLNTAQSDMTKQKKGMATADKVIKSKEVFAATEVALKESLAEVERVENMLQSEGVADQAILEMEAVSTATLKQLKGVVKDVELKSGTMIQTLKASFTELREKSKTAQETLQKAREGTKDQRERVLCESYVKEGQKMVAEVEAAMEKVNDAELPFLKGIEVMELMTATESIRDSEAAAEVAKKALASTKTYLTTKTAEIAPFNATYADPAKEELAELTQKLTTSANTLNQFWKDLDSRKKSARMQEATEKITSLEAEVTTVVEAAEPFVKGEAESMSEEQVNELCSKFLEMEKECNAKVAEVRKFLGDSLNQVRGNIQHTEALKKLQAQFSALGTELAKAKKASTSYESAVVARKVHAEVQAMVEEMTTEAGKASTACAPLIEEKGERFLVIANLRLIAAALRDYMASKELNEDGLFKEISEGKAEVTAERFCAYLTKLPTDLEKEDLTCTKERQDAIFKHLAGPESEVLSAEEFKKTMFLQRYTCYKEISITDGLDVATSSTKGKLQAGDVVETTKNPKQDESGMLRLECSKVGTDITGWVTVKGNQETTFLKQSSPVDAFISEVDKSIDTASKAVNRILGQVRQKSFEFPKITGTEGKLVEAKNAFTKLQTQANTMQGSIMALKKRLALARMEYNKKEQAERNAHIVAREQKEADTLLAPAVEKLKTAEEAVRIMGDAASPILSVTGAELDGFKTPLTVLEEVEKLIGSVMDASAAAKETVKEQQGKMGKNTHGPIAEARKELIALMGKADAVGKKGQSLMQSVKEACNNIMRDRLTKASMAMRSEVQAKGSTLEKLFEELAGEEEGIQEGTLCQQLLSIDGIGLEPEHARLICRHIGAGSIGKHAFMQFLQRYYIVVKATVVTDDFDIATTKVIRKAEPDEVVELLEGPRADEKAKLVRVRARSLKDDATGWISMKGNQGTPFLEEVDKPFYVCLEDGPLDADAKGKEKEPVRQLVAGEVLELLQGPQKEKAAPLSRARGKAVKDGAIGWITVKDGRGKMYAEEGTYYACTAAVAMTDGLDSKTSKVIRRLGVGELLAKVEEPEEEAGGIRMKCTAFKDDKEGYVTIKTSGGTTYAAPSPKHYVLVQEAPLQRTFESADYPVIRRLAVGEVFHVLEGPREERGAPDLRIKGKVLGDGSEGWISLGLGARPWSPYYICQKATAITDTAQADAKVVRELTAGEHVELLEGPRAAPGDGGVVQMRGRAGSDGTVGWLTIRSNETGELLEPRGPSKGISRRNSE